MTLPQVEVKKILYATDLSENARYAFAYAVSLANLYGAKITLLHVLPEVPDKLERRVAGYIDADRWNEIKQAHYDEAKDTLIGKRKDRAIIGEVLHQFSQDSTNAKAGEASITDEIIVERGNPVEQILKQTEANVCDLIVMGTHGHGTLADAMIGSTTRRVIRRSRKPVLVIRLPEEC